MNLLKKLLIAFVVINLLAMGVLCVMAAPVNYVMMDENTAVGTELIVTSNGVNLRAKDNQRRILAQMREGTRVTLVENNGEFALVKADNHEGLCAVSFLAVGIDNGTATDTPAVTPTVTPELTPEASVTPTEVEPTVTPEAEHEQTSPFADATVIPSTTSSAAVTTVAGLGVSNIPKWAIAWVALAILGLVIYGIWKISRR